MLEMCVVHTRIAFGVCCVYVFIEINWEGYNISVDISVLAILQSL